VSLTPVEVHHTVPTFGFLVERGNTAAAIATDTGPTQRLWELVNRCHALRAVFLDASFPDEMEGLARISGHLTPALFAAEAAKIHRPCRLIAVHIKAAYRQRVIDELTALGIPGVEVGAAEAPYDL
jgi:ribonuclease BN (tRNA processing enzyme)